MKVTNWKKRIASTLLAAGVFVPSAALAYDIPLADPSFEDYIIPTGGSLGSQFAYANLYRPSGSAWIDDQDHNSAPYVQDTNPSSWLYTTGYADKGSGARRGSPLHGSQAMHGLFRYSTQETSAVFEAGKTYTFSIFAQGDHDAEPNGGNWQSRVFLYLFDGSIPFSEANSLVVDRFSPTDNINTGPSDFVNRDPSWTASQSQSLGWSQISISHTVAPGAPEIGNPIGVGFWAGDDACLDVAALTATPEPGSAVLLGIGGLGLLGRRRRI
jgi:hypothetical protein